MLPSSRTATQTLLRTLRLSAAVYCRSATTNQSIKMTQTFFDISIGGTPVGRIVFQVHNFSTQLFNCSLCQVIYEFYDIHIATIAGTSRGTV